MADLTTDFLGIKSPNPFWLASAPPTDKEYNVRRAFEAGWGGVVWKTLGAEGPPVVNVNGPRYGVIHGPDRRVLGLNNIELITDRPLGVNLEEITRVKKDYPTTLLSCPSWCLVKNRHGKTFCVRWKRQVRMGSSSTSDAHTECPKGAWARLLDRFLSISKWSQAGAKNTILSQ